VQQTQPLQVGGLPLAVTFFSNGCIVLQAVGSFHTIFDIQEDGELFVIYQEELLISDKSFCYNSLYEISHEPLLKKWLIAQNMQSPV
jgi:hypothetical protein